MIQRKRSAELAALTNIAAQVNCTQDLEEILGGALQTTLDVIGEDSGEIFLIDDETSQLNLHTHLGVSQEFVDSEARVNPGECLCGQAIKTRKAIFASDLAAHPDVTRQACLREGFHACVRLPILARGKRLGLLNIQSRETRHFDSHDRDFLTAIGHQIGTAIANAQLIEDAERGRATLNSVMNSLVDGLVLLDNHKRVGYVNPRAKDILGFPALELVGQTLEDMEQGIAQAVDDPDIIIEKLDAAVKDPFSNPVVELCIRSPKPTTVQARFFAIQDSHGDSVGIGLLLRDITREKELDEMKSQLLATVGHELRTPLASIKGFATTLLRQDVRWDDASRREFLTIIDTESDRLAELIANLLDMSRIEAGSLRVEPEPVDVRPIIQETAKGFQMMTRVPTIDTELPSPLPMVLADPRRLRQVLRNLVENAVKYSPEGGLIRVKAELGPGHIHIAVADQGIGIEAHDLERVFDRFYQVDSASTRTVGGSGLGLAICKAIVEAHQGAIWAESQPGEGSTFHFTLPLATSQTHSEGEES